MASNPINFSSTPASIRRLPPRLGEHTEEILLQAGYSPDQVATLLDSGVARDITREDS